MNTAAAVAFTVFVTIVSESAKCLNVLLVFHYLFTLTHWESRGVNVVEENNDNNNKNYHNTDGTATIVQ